MGKKEEYVGAKDMTEVVLKAVKEEIEAMAVVKMLVKKIMEDAFVKAMKKVSEETDDLDTVEKIAYKTVTAIAFKGILDIIEAFKEVDSVYLETVLSYFEKKKEQKKKR